MTDALRVNVSIAGHDRIDFDRRSIRKVIAQESRAVRAEARRLISRRAVSEAGQFPGQDTGDFRRSISAKTKGRGFVGIVEPKRTARMNARDFYPTILMYGVEGRIAPRANPVATALDNRRSDIQTALRAALEQSLIPRR